MISHICFFAHVFACVDGLVSTHGETTFPCASWKIARIATTAVVVATARRCCRRCCRRRCRCLRNQSHRHRRVVPSATAAAAAAAAAAATRRLTSRGTSVGAVVPLLWLARPSPSVFRFVSPRVWRVCVCVRLCVCVASVCVCAVPTEVHKHT